MGPVWLLLLLLFHLQSLKAELKAKTEALATNERQRVQYEAIANSKQQVRPGETRGGVGGVQVGG